MTTYRVREQNNERVIETYVGKRPDLSDSDDPQRWRELMRVGPNQIIGDFVKVSADLEVAEIPGGVVISVGGTRHGIPMDQVKELAAKLQEIIGG